MQVSLLRKYKKGQESMQVSIAAANLHRVRTIVKRARNEIDKVDNEKVNPLKIISSFPDIKEQVNQTNGSKIHGIDRLITN